MISREEDTCPKVAMRFLEKEKLMIIRSLQTLV